MLYHRQHGFTLAECLITLAVIALMLSLAVPSLHRTISNTHRTNTTALIFQNIQYAKSEAIKRNQIIAICGSEDGQTCDGQWSTYLLVVNVKDSKVLRQQNFKGDNQIELFSSVSKNAFNFSPTGRALARGHFEIRHDDTIDKIVIYDSGRARIEHQQAV